MQIKKYIPNALTLLNLLSGLIAIVEVFNGYLDHAFYFLFLGIFFDFLDGFFARKFNVCGALGLQLDSLADMVTSGVVPGLMMFKLFESIQLNDPEYMLTEETYYMGVVPYLGFIITLASCYRLAKFNVSTNQKENFIGLPTPANALLILSIPMIQYNRDGEWTDTIFSNPYVLLAITFLSAYLLNCKIVLFSFKIKDFKWQSIKVQVVFLIYSLLVLFFFQFLGMPIIILSYILVSRLLS